MGLETALMLAMTGGSILSGALGGRAKTSTSSTTPNWTPEQGMIQNQLGGMLSTEAMDPTKGIDRLRPGGIQTVNKAFQGAESRIDEDLASRGFQNSGLATKGKRKVAIARAGAQAGANQKYDAMELDQKNRIYDLMERYAFASPGQSQTTTGPSNVLGGAVSGGLETAMTLFGLQQIMGNGSGGSGGAYAGMGW